MFRTGSTQPTLIDNKETFLAKWTIERQQCEPEKEELRKVRETDRKERAAATAAVKPVKIEP